MKPYTINLYGEGTRIDVFQPDDDLCDCFNAMRDAEYFSIRTDDGEYSLDDLGATIYDSYWPEDIYDEDEEKFVDPAYEQFAGKEPSDVFDFDGCDLYEAEDEGLERIDWIQTKIEATVTIELNDGEEFDPKKFHFMYSEFVLPVGEMEVNTGVVYDGKQYPIDLDIDSEREISVETLWEA